MGPNVFFLFNYDDKMSIIDSTILFFTDMNNCGCEEDDSSFKKICSGGTKKNFTKIQYLNRETKKKKFFKRFLP